MEQLPISLCVVTYNSEGRLKKLIERHRPLVREIIVVDQGSTDGTWEEAKAGADIAIQKTRKGCVEPERQYSVDLATQDWVLVLDDDEEVSDGLLAVLPDILDSPATVVWLKFLNTVEGVDIKEILGDDPHLRLFRRGTVVWPTEMHSWPQVSPAQITLYTDAVINHVRTWEKTKRSNIAREAITDARTKDMQNQFLRMVETLLLKNGVKV